VTESLEVTGVAADSGGTGAPAPVRPAAAGGAVRDWRSACFCAAVARRWAARRRRRGLVWTKKPMVASPERTATAIIAATARSTLRLSLSLMLAAAVVGGAGDVVKGVAVVVVATVVLTARAVVVVTRVVVLTARVVAVRAVVATRTVVVTSSAGATATVVVAALVVLGGRDVVAAVVVVALEVVVAAVVDEAVAGTVVDAAASPGAAQSSSAPTNDAPVMVNAALAMCRDRPPAEAVGSDRVIRRTILTSRPAMLGPGVRALVPRARKGRTTTDGASKEQRAATRTMAASHPSGLEVTRVRATPLPQYLNRLVESLV
jgi:hypothetical protein